MLRRTTPIALTVALAVSLCVDSGTAVASAKYVRFAVDSHGFQTDYDRYVTHQPHRFPRRLSIFDTKTSKDRRVHLPAGCQFRGTIVKADVLTDCAGGATQIINALTGAAVILPSTVAGEPNVKLVRWESFGTAWVQASAVCGVVACGAYFNRTTGATVVHDPTRGQTYVARDLDDPGLNRGAQCDDRRESHGDGLQFDDGYFVYGGSRLLLARCGIPGRRVLDRPDPRIPGSSPNDPILRQGMVSWTAPDRRALKTYDLATGRLRRWPVPGGRRCATGFHTRYAVIVSCRRPLSGDHGLDYIETLYWARRP